MKGGCLVSKEIPEDNTIMLKNTHIKFIVVDGEMYINKNYKEEDDHNEVTVLKMFYDDVAETLFHTDFTKMVK